MTYTRRGHTNFDPPNRLQPTRTPTTWASGHRPAPGNDTGTPRAARDVDVSKKHAHADAQLVEMRTMDPGAMGRPGVGRAHLACHEQTGEALNGGMCMCERVVCAGRGLSGWEGFV